MKKHSYRDRKRSVLVSCPGLVALVLVPWALASCTSKSEGDGENKSTTSIENLQEDAAAALEKAKEAGAEELFAEDFEKQAAKIEQATAAIEEGGDKTKATNSYKTAISQLRRLEKNAAALQKVRGQAIEAKTAADEAEQKARESKTDVDAPREFKAARDEVARAEGYLKSVEEQKLLQAERSFKRAADLFAEANTAAAGNRDVKERAKEEKEAMLKAKAKAQGAEAEKLVATEWTAACQVERQAESEFKAGNYQRAYDSFRQAEQDFAGAASRADQQKQLAAANQPNPAPAPAPVEPENIVQPAPEATPPDAPRTPEPAVEPVPPPADLSDEDGFLLANYQKLGRGVQGYDPGSGAVTIAYNLGSDLRRDITHPNPKLPYNEKFLKFVEPMVNQEDVKREQQEGNSQYSFTFSGNTQGFFLIPIPLKGSMTMDYVINLGLMDSTGGMSAVFYSDASGANSYGLDFITPWKRTNGGAPKRFPNITNPKLTKNPNTWFDKVNPVPMRLEVAPHPDKEGSSRIQVFYKYGQDEGEKPASILEIKGEASGYVGFQWNRVAFNVRALKITGTLDKKAAIEILKKKMGIKDSPPAKSPSGAESAKPAAGDAKKTGAADTKEGKDGEFKY
jgi:hypothetical protein